MSFSNLKTGKIVGAAADRFWAQTHVFLPEKGEKKAVFGGLLVNFSLEAKKERIDTASFGKEIIARFHELYYSSEEKEVLKRLKLAIQKLTTEFLETVRLEISAAVILEKESYLVGYFALFGPGQLMLFRDRRLTLLLRGKEEELKSSSGYLQETDVFILATSQFFKLVNQRVLEKSLESPVVDQVVESLAPMIHTAEANSQTAAVVFKLVQGLKAESVKPADPVLQEKEKRLKGFLAKSLLLVKNAPFLAKKLFQEFRRQPNIFIKDRKDKAKAKKTTLSVAIILIALLLISIILGSRKKTAFQESQASRSALEEAEYKYEQAVSLVELNPLRARSLLNEVKTTLKEAAGEPAGEKERAKLGELLSQVETKLEEVGGEYRLEEADIFLDLGLVKEDFQGADWEFGEGDLQVLDKEKGTILEINVASKKAKVSAGGEQLKQALAIGATEKRILVLKKEKLLLIDKGKGEMVDQKEAEDWGEIVDLVGFAENGYLLDIQRGKVWKYPSASEGLADPGNYFQEGGFNLEGAVSLTIDGSVWILFTDGTVVKFTRGLKDIFLMNGLEADFNQPEKIYTDHNLDSLYILDRKNTRVVVVNKETGEYQAQYIWPGIAGAVDLFASEEEKKILLLTGERIYEIPLKN